MSPPEALPLFFTSYAHADEDGSKLADTMAYLERRVAQKIGAGSGDGALGFRARPSIRTGEQWREALGDALRTARVLCVMCSPNVYRSEWCAREADAFRLRLAQAADSVRAVLPVLWEVSPFRRMPSTLSRYQLDDGAFPLRYREGGLRKLRQVKGRFYEVTIDALAEAIVRTSKTGELPPWPAPFHPDELEAVFHNPLADALTVIVRAEAPGGLRWQSTAQADSLAELVDNATGNEKLGWTAWRAGGDVLAGRDRPLLVLLVSGDVAAGPVVPDGWRGPAETVELTGAEAADGQRIAAAVRRLRERALAALPARPVESGELAAQAAAGAVPHCGGPSAFGHGGYTVNGSDGKIVTFYSYKGGTGRTMALANVAWLLASNGHRVLVVDWDFEAPGLHRYFRPFLDDPELATSEGLIDYFSEFALASRSEPSALDVPDGEPWWRPWASLYRFTYSLNWEFPGEGTVDLVPAGRQDLGYSGRVAAFDWSGFYHAAGGGLLLEALKRTMRDDYDYVLIDSRTGVADTAGICTVAMPDEVVVLFTPNNQSILGAAAVAASIESQRCLPSGEPKVRIWPVPSRIDLAEKDRLDAARVTIRQTFGRYIRHLPRAERLAYWGGIEVAYQPYYAYEEVLATFGDMPGNRLALLGVFEELATRLAPRVPGSPPVPIRATAVDPNVRQQVLAQFSPALSPSGQRPARLFVSYGSADRPLASLVVEGLRRRGLAAASDLDLRPGDDWRAFLADQLDRSDVVVVLIGSAQEGLAAGVMAEVEAATVSGKRIVPVVGPTVAFGSLPKDLLRWQAVFVSVPPTEEELDRLAMSLRELPRGQPTSPDLDDPQRGRFGGSPQGGGRELIAEVEGVTDDWFRIVLTVRAAAGFPPLGPAPVAFHLHPTFTPVVRLVEPVDGVARLELHGWGAFTVGVVADSGRTRLELDLSTIPTAPPTFRAR